MNIIGKKPILTLTTAAALGIGAVSTAHAGALAVSVLEVENLLFQDSAGTTLPISFFQNLVGENTGDVLADLVSVPGTATDETSVSILDPVTGGAIDLGVCQGPSCLPFGPNDFSHTAPPPTSIYVLSDNELEGSAIDLGTGTSGADARVRGDASLLNTDVGTAQTNLGLNTDFTFTAGSTQQVQFSFDYDSYVRSFVDVGFDDNSSASAAINWTITAFGPGVDFTWSPDPLNSNRSTTGPGDNVFEQAGSLNSLSAGFDLITFQGGQEYTVTIRHSSFADATLRAPGPIPEPTSIALLGGGLLGLAAIRKRAKKA